MPEVMAPPPAFDRVGVEAKTPEARSIAEVLQLAAVVTESKQETARRLEQELQRDPTGISKKATLSQLRKLVEDPVTARQALGLIAGLQGSVGPDVLYEVWVGTPHRTETTELARALLATREVRAKASESLAIDATISALTARRAPSAFEGTH
jgi:hypothetical protein